jgi:hypothetical protein
MMRQLRRRPVLAAVVLASAAAAAATPMAATGGDTVANAARFERAVAACDRVMRAWLAHADARTLLLPDRPDAERAKWIYTPHNSGADLYPYLILTAHLTDPDLYRGRMMEMLRSEIRHTTVQKSIPANLPFDTHQAATPSFFGAGEYAKDGLIAVTEYLGRTPWFYRMVDMIADAMTDGPVASRFGPLPAADAELNGDYLQSLVRLATMTGDERFVTWARRIGDAYADEVLPGSGGVPGFAWDFAAHTGERRLRLRDHGNETVVGLTMLLALEHQLHGSREEKYRAVVQKMLDRVLASANADGLLYNEVDVDTLAPLDQRLSDNWGYVYGAVYAYYQVTGDARYRDAVRRVLANLPKYRNYPWEPRPNRPLGSFDGYADAIESAIYLYNRERVPEAASWIESEMQVMLGMQRDDGHVEDWYGEGNFNRTALLYAYMQSQGVRPLRWEPGVRVGAVPDGAALRLHVGAPAARTVTFDFARHRRVLNLERNYVRLNEFPEWFVVDENTLYALRREGAGDAPLLRLGSELVAGVELVPGNWRIEPLGPPPYAGRALP